MKKMVFMAGIILAAAIAFVGCSDGTTDPAATTGTEAASGTEAAADTTGTALNVTNQACVTWKLPSAVESGTVVSVEIKGTNNGTAGFRSWLVDNSQTTLSNQYVDAKGAGLPSGAFDLKYDLTATGTATNFFVKGAAYGTNIDNVDFTYITVTINGTTTKIDPSTGTKA